MTTPLFPVRFTIPLLQGASRFLLFLALLIMVGSGFPRRASAQQAPTPEVALTTSSNYKLSPGDLFDFRVYQESDLDAVVRLSGDGSAIFPLIGSVKLGGLTIEQASALLQNRYKDGYLANPQITITVRSFAKKFYTMLGQIARPGAYDMQGEEEIPLFQAVGLAGGYTKIADPSKITVKRQVDQGETILRLNAKKMAGGSEKSTFMIRAGDIITVGESLF